MSYASQRTSIAIIALRIGAVTNVILGLSTMMLAFEHWSHLGQAAILQNSDRLLVECIFGMSLPFFHVAGLLTGVRLAATDIRRALGAILLPCLWSISIINFTHTLVS